MPSKPPKGKFGKALRKARLRKNWSQKQLAQKMGLECGAVISRFERGHHKGMQTRNLVKFSKVLGISMDELMG